MRIDDSLRLAGQLLAAHMQQTPVKARQIAGLLHTLHQDVVRIQSGSYSAWQDELPELDVLDQAELDRITPKTYPPPTHPLADPAVPVEERIAGTVLDTKLVCLECGKQVTLMRSHLQTSHADMPWSEYLDRHGLPRDYPPAAPSYRAMKGGQTRAQRAAQREAKAAGVDGDQAA